MVASHFLVSKGKKWCFFCFYMFSTRFHLLAYQCDSSWEWDHLLFPPQAGISGSPLITYQRPRASGRVFPRVVQWDGVPAGRPWARGPLAPDTPTSQHPSCCVRGDEGSKRNTETPHQKKDDRKTSRTNRDFPMPPQCWRFHKYSYWIRRSTRRSRQRLCKTHSSADPPGNGSFDPPPKLSKTGVRDPSYPNISIWVTIVSISKVVELWKP